MTIYEVSSTHGLDTYPNGTAACVSYKDACRVRDEVRDEYDSEADWRAHVTIDRVTVEYKGVGTIIDCINGEKYAAERVQVWPKKRGPSQAYMDRVSAEMEAELQRQRAEGGTSGDEER